MDNYKEITDVLRKVSLASITKPIGYEDQLSKDSHKPKDAFNLVHILCVLLGLLNILPLTFFITANDYWMYKFRDVSKDTVDLNNKTTLQTYFVSGIVVVETVPSMVFMLLATTLGHRFKLYPRMIITLILMITTFVVFTFFININTDTWQLGFFIVTLLGISLITGVLNLFQVTSLALIPKFPPIYMRTFLFGQGAAGVFGPTLQIISLAIGTSTKTSAMVYFVSGTMVILTTFILFIFCQRLAFYQHYMQINLGDVKKTYSKQELKTVFIQIWPVSAILIVLFITLYLTHPSVTALIVSENYGHGNLWNDLYFVPAITFLFGEFCSTMGRLLSRPIITKSNGHWMVGISVLRMVILVPLVLLCNAQPRHHLPVLLKHDWQYILLCVVYFFTSGFSLSAVILSIPQLAPNNEDVAYLVMMSVIGISAGLLSPISLGAVRFL